MKNNRYIGYLALFFYLALFQACKSSNAKFEVFQFSPVSNANLSDGIYKTNLNFQYAIDSGFVIPSYAIDSISRFHFSFKLKNMGNESKRYAYKLYYQNESNKFDENSDSSNLVAENFYGSWESQSGNLHYSVEVKPGETIIVTDSFKIYGNPRDELKYFGNERNDKYYSQYELYNQIKQISSDSVWLADVKRKALINNISLEEQLSDDAIFIIHQRREEITNNQRWKRNPRVGDYEAMLVVIEENFLSEIPNYIIDISQTYEENFVNPFFYFKNIPQHLQNNILIQKSTFLNVKANLPLMNGIYFNKSYYKQKEYLESCLGEKCNNDSIMFHNAAFEHFIHQMDNIGNLENIPIVADVQGNIYSYDQHNLDKIIPGDQRLSKPVEVTNCPCSNVGVDVSDQSLYVVNSGSSENNPRKENTGLATRHGFTYGKFRMKVNLPNLLNKSGMWNGLTNAIWMINEDNAEWNSRRICKKDGYLQRNDSGNKDALRHPQLSYSEIDFEIVKATSDWPKSSYSILNYATKPPPLAIDEIVVTCTNWDLACSDPVDFHVGAKDFNTNGTLNTLHRWDHWYCALTTKIPFKDSELFGRDYYFEIEWKPKEIIWRIGEDSANLKVVARMSDAVTSIPNNQMLMVLTQEFHLADWWPGQPFSQNDVPFPLNDIKGKILELVIE